jgi:hypothetical protein
MYHTAIYNPAGDMMVVFGGIDGSSFHSDVWTLSFTGTPAWSRITPTGVPPSARYRHSAIHDPVRARMVVFGGHDVSYSNCNDSWVLSLTGTPAWIQLSPAGTLPSPRQGQSAVYDPQSDQMLIFGGFDGGYRNDAWSLSLSGTAIWSQLTPSGSPPSPRSAHAAAYDLGENRMIVFAGNDASSLLNDLWTLSLSGTPAWSELSTVAGLRLPGGCCTGDP